MADENWERTMIERLATEGLLEQQRARRWGIFFKLLGFGCVFLVLFLALASFGATDRACVDKCTAVVDLRGELDSDGRASAENVIAGLQAAFKEKGTQGVILRIDSPGGSPVQAGAINDEIRRLRAKYPETPIYSVVEEICASGAYYVAVATDKIFVDKASLVGSIGVIMEGFGFVGAMEKLGVERRALTAGQNKDFLDQFAPVVPTQKEFAQQMLDEIHLQFITAVKQGRGTRLKETPDMFSGLVWSGQRSIELGLTDALGTVDSVARDVIKAEDVVDFTQQETLADRVARKFGASMGSTLASSVGKSLRLR
jgi:protease IV